MPFALIHIMEGRDEAKKTAMIKAVTEAISTSLDTPRENVRVLVQEIPKSQWGIGGKTAAELGR